MMQSPPSEPRSAAPTDQLGRRLRSLRISVTDRCNMRCRYCMPEAEYRWLPRESVLSFEEIDRLAGIFTRLGVEKIRLTGGEPLLRHDLPVLIRMLASQPSLDDLALTTNGLLLAGLARPLKAAGLGRLTVSLDTLRAERLREFARTPRHADIVDGLGAAEAAGFRGTKLNSVIMRGFNEDEICDLVEFGKEHDLEVRFIEYMDVGGATGWRPEAVVSAREILDRLARRYGGIEPVVNGLASAPADRYRLPDGTIVGIIASTTRPFCRTCDRARLTADGHFLLCLYADSGLDLRYPLRDGASDAELAALIENAWRGRADRGAEERAATADRGALYTLDALRADPRREMHTRGG